MIYIATGFTGTVYPLNHGRVCWNWYDGTVTASTSASGFAAVNAMPPRTDSAWRPTAIPATWDLAFASAQDVSFIGIAKHDLGTKNATIAIQRDISGGSEIYASFDGLGAVQPEDDSPLLFLVPVTNVDGLRIEITAADAPPTIALIMAGEAMEMPRPFTWTGQPITEGDRIGFENTISMTGNWLGRTKVSDGQQFELTMQHASEAWRQGAFADFKAYANGEDAAFFIAARPGTYPNELAYAWATEVVTASREMPNKNISTSVTLSCQGLRPYV